MDEPLGEPTHWFEFQNDRFGRDANRYFCTFVDCPRDVLELGGERFAARVRVHQETTTPFGRVFETGSWLIVSLKRLNPILDRENRKEDGHE